jgi:PAS domain S-box-containing protein
MQPTFADPRLLAAVLLAGLVIYVLSVVLVAVVVALEEGEPVARYVQTVLTEDLKGEVAAHSSLVATGTLAAMVARTSPWGILLILVPIVATYTALKREVQLRYEAEQARIMSDDGLAEAQRMAHLGSWDWYPAVDRWVWSDEVYRLLGVTPQSIAPSTRALLDAVPEADRARVEQVLRDARGDCTSFDIVHRVRRANGAERFVHQRGSVRSDDDRRAGFRGTIQDVTDRVRTEEVMRQAKENAQEAERAKTQLLRMASHDLRSPLTAIQGFLEIVVSDATDNLSNDQREFLDIAYRNAVQLTNLVNDLLDLARIEASQLTLQLSPVPLDPIAEDVLETVKPQAEAKGLLLHYAPGCAAAIALADPARLRQVLLNLVTNAVKFTDGGSVTISTRQDGASVAIEVADTGIGIAPEVLPHVFEEFRQGGEAARRRGGTGLGLAIVKRLIDLHQGTISVHSVEGEGSTFTLHLPAASRALIPENSPRV